MTLVNEINEAMKADKTIIGARESIKFLKTGSPKKIVFAKNVPENLRKEIERSSKVSGAETEMYEGSSKELGVACGKPFPISVLIIK